jgi:hypothetical protein
MNSSEFKARFENERAAEALANPAPFDHWAILEIMGHQRYAGRVTEQVIAGAAFVRVDVPAGQGVEAFTKLFGPGSIYAITPTTELLARGVAAELGQRPVEIYDLPEEMRRKLAPSRQPALPHFSDDDIADVDAAMNNDDEDGPF